MDPEQFVAQLAELRTQNQQLHQALQQVQQQQSQQQSLIQTLSDLPQPLPQTVGSAMLAAASPARTKPTLVDTKGLGKPPPLKNTESEFVSWARRTQNFVVSVHPGASDVLTWAVERELGTVTEANTTTEVVMLAYHLYTVLMTLVERESFILVVSGSGEGLEDGGVCINVGTPWRLEEREDCSEKSFHLDVPSWSSCKEQWNDGGFDEASQAKKRRTEWSAPYVDRGHQDGVSFFFPFFFFSVFLLFLFFFPLFSFFFFVFQCFFFLFFFFFPERWL